MLYRNTVSAELNSKTCLPKCWTTKNKKMQTNNDIDIELQETQSDIKENASSENIMETYPSITLQSLIDDIKKGHIDTYNNNQDEEKKEQKNKFSCDFFGRKIHDY